MNLAKSAGLWFRELGIRILSGGEPLIVRWLVATAVVVAAKAGFDWNAEVVWGFLAVTAPAMMSGRAKVEPSDNTVGWRDMIKAAFSNDSDIDESADNGDPAGDPEVGPTGEPDWLEEFTSDEIVPVEEV